MRITAAATRPLRRYISSTPCPHAANKLPFEKPLFDSTILRNAAREEASYNRLELLGNVAVIVAGVSAVARLGYYAVNGKQGGAAALPPRS